METGVEAVIATNRRILLVYPDPFWDVHIQLFLQSRSQPGGV